jgi:hypothetical protein
MRAFVACALMLIGLVAALVTSLGYTGGHDLLLLCKLVVCGACWLSGYFLLRNR